MMKASGRALAMFRGREDEIRFLNDVYESEGMRTCAVLGRRRIGKSTILEKFCSDKRSLYVEFENSSESRNVEKMVKALKGFGVDTEGIKDFGDTLDALSEVVSEERTVVVLDEYPYLTSWCKSASAMLKNFIDECLNHTDSMLVICGSSLSVMNDEISRKNKPLYGRFVQRLEVGPMPFDECRGFNPELEDLDSVMLYLTLGGVPMYHQFARGKNYRECVKNLFFGQHPLLDDESSAILEREVSPLQKYNAVMDAIGGGAVTTTDIANKTGLGITLCQKYLKKLKAIGIVEAVHPMLDAPKGPTYEIADSLIAFEYEVLKRYGASIPLADPDMLFDELEGIIRTFLGKRFERMCADYVRSHYVCKEIGRWWGKGGIGVGTDIDVVAVVRSKNRTITLLGECKFRNDESGFDAYNALKAKADFLSRSRDVRLIMFSASGFKDNLRSFAEENGTLLVDLDTLLGRRPAPDPFS